MKLIKCSWLLVFLTIFTFVQSVSAQSENQTVKVNRGDTFLEIALKNGVTVEQLQAANPSVDPDMILAGQELIIPPSDSTAFRLFMNDFYRQSVRIDSSNCYAQTDLSAVCLVQITSLSDAPIANLRFEFTLPDSNGMEITKQAAPFLAVLLPGERQLFSFSLAGSFNLPAAANGTITSLQLFPAADFSLRLPETAYEAVLESNSSGTTAIIQFHLNESATGSNHMVVAQAFNSDGLPVGVRAVLLENTRETGLTVFALTDQIEKIEIQVEGY